MCKSNVSCICIVPIAIFSVILIMIIVIYYEVSWMEELNAVENGKSHQHLNKKIKNKLYKLILNLEIPPENDVAESRDHQRSHHRKRTRTTTPSKKATTTKRRKLTTTTTREPETATTTRKPTTSRKPKTTRPKTSRKPEKTQAPVRLRVPIISPDYMELSTIEVGEKDPPEWLSLSANAFNMWMHECRERDEASSDEGEDITDVQANFPYDKYSLKLTYLTHPSLHPIAAIVLVVKKILIGTFFLGVVFLIFIVMAFTKVKQTSGIGYLTDRLSNINSFQSIINHFRASNVEKTDDPVLVLHSPTSSRSSVVSLSTILEETSPLLLCQDDLLEHLQSDDELRSVIGSP